MSVAEIVLAVVVFVLLCLVWRLFYRLNAITSEEEQYRKNRRQAYAGIRERIYAIQRENDRIENGLLILAKRMGYSMGWVCPETQSPPPKPHWVIQANDTQESTDNAKKSC